MDQQTRDTMDAGIRAYLQWYEDRYENVPPGMFGEVDEFLDEMENAPEPEGFDF